MKFSFPSFWKNASSRRKRIYSFLFILLLVIIVTIIGVLIPTTPQQDQEITNQVNQTVINGKDAGTLASSIFINNFSLCLLMFLPLVGSLIGLAIMLNTGYVIGAELRYQLSQPNAAASASSVTPSNAFLILALAAVTFICEYVSYSIGISESIWLFRRLTQKRWMELKYTAILIGITAILLTTGALVEAYALGLA